MSDWLIYYINHYLFIFDKYHLKLCNGDAVTYHHTYISVMSSNSADNIVPVQVLVQDKNKKMDFGSHQLEISAQILNI